jgi:hypothetical protein
LMNPLKRPSTQANAMTAATGGLRWAATKPPSRIKIGPVS